MAHPEVTPNKPQNIRRATNNHVPKAIQWSSREEEYVKRAGFVLMADLAVHDKKAKDQNFTEFLKIIEREAVDERNFVKKAVNWALRQIGKRNVNLNLEAIEACEEIQKSKSKSARWIASEALRELRSEKVQEKVRGKSRSSSQPKIRVA
jgi:3-methyladenine DNA glycosylase AlkD